MRVPETIWEETESKTRGVFLEAHFALLANVSILESDTPLTYSWHSSWADRCQANISLSTSEADFVTTSQAGQKALYLRETLKDFGYQK